MRLKHLLLGTALAVASAGAAQAGTIMPDGWYVSLAAGANWVPNDNVRWNTSASSGTNFRYDWNTGYAVLASVGYDFTEHWRAEFEVGYRHNKSKSACTAGGCFDPDFGPTPGLAPDEPAWQLSEMVNVLYDFGLGGGWTASVGAGIGGNLVVFEDEGHEFDDYVFAGQLIGEIGYRFSDRWQAFARWRHLYADPYGFDQPHRADRHPLRSTVGSCGASAASSAVDAAGKAAHLHRVLRLQQVQLVGGSSARRI